MIRKKIMIFQSFQTLQRGRHWVFENFFLVFLQSLSCEEVDKFIFYFIFIGDSFWIFFFGGGGGKYYIGVKKTNVYRLAYRTTNRTIYKLSKANAYCFISTCITNIYPLHNNKWDHSTKVIMHVTFTN